MNERLQAGIDFSQKRADFCLLAPNGLIIERHRRFSNSRPGYEEAKAMLLKVLTRQHFQGLDVAGEATNVYWLPFFWELARDPELAAHDVQLFLLNPRWVKYYKQCFAPDHKSDADDPFYIADRLRTRHPTVAWSAQLDTQPLRLYTRLRFHLIQNLAREKCYLAGYLFLRASAYSSYRPFSDPFGMTSRRLLREDWNLERLATLSVEELAQHLDELSEHHLPDPLANARKLCAVAHQSFRVPQTLNLPLQRLTDLILQEIAFLETQITQADSWITAEAQQHPGVHLLDTIPGIGPVFASGILAEIGSVERFLQGPKWDPKHKTYRARNLRDAEDAVAKIAGLWWPRNSSGDFDAEDRRLSKSGNRYLRYYLIEAADRMRQNIPEYQRFYASKYAEALKHQHKRALVLTARKSVGLIVGLLHRHESYRSKEVDST